MSSHHVWHTIRFSPNGNWQPWGDVEGVVGDLGLVGELGLGDLGGNLHFLATAEGTLWHSIRFSPAGNWQPWGNVEATAAGNPGPLHGAAASHLGADLHVPVLTWSDQATGASKVGHTIRFSADGSWQPIGNASAAAGDPNARFARIACANAGGDLHVVAATTGGQIMHTIRFTQAQSWQPWGNLTAVLGAPPSNAGERLAALACAGIAGDLHVSCATAPLIT